MFEIDVIRDGLKAFSIRAGDPRTFRDVVEFLAHIPAGSMYTFEYWEYKPHEMARDRLQDLLPGGYRDDIDQVFKAHGYPDGDPMRGRTSLRENDHRRSKKKGRKGGENT